MSVLEANRAELADFPVLRPIQTRWADNDQNGHLNNAVYYSFFDTLINGWLAEVAGTDGATDVEIPVVAESGCRYLAELAFPEQIQAGLRVERVGRTSVTYELGLFDASGQCAALGWWVHVYIHRQSRSTVPLPDGVRRAVESL